MPFKAPPTTCYCEKCGWKQTVIPLSDVLIFLPSCPKCEHAPMAHRLATASEAMAAKLKGLLGKV